MKQQILEALKAKFPGVNANILNRIAERLAKTVTKEEDVPVTVEDVTFQSVLESYGDSRATEATQSAVTNYEKRHGLKDGQKATQEGSPEITPGAIPANGKDETPAWAKSILESNKALADKIAAMEGEKVVNTRKQRLAGILSKAPAKFKERIEKDFNRLSFADEEDFASWLDDVQTDTEAAIAEGATKGAVFGVPGASNSRTPSQKEATDADIDTLVAHM